MSRSNPFKKKRRAAKQTLLIYGEGLAEEIFLKLLRRHYAHNSGIAVTVRKGKGGTADGIVKSAIQYLGNFNRRVVVLDNDKQKKEMETARQIGKENAVEVIENTPCLEGLLLGILTDNNWTGHTSTQCKKEFENKYIESKKRSEPLEYQKIFPSKLLEENRKRLPTLNRLISLMKGE